VNWLSYAPDWVTLVLFVVVPAGVAVGVHAVIRRLIPHEKLSPHHDVAGFLVAIVGVLYAVVLGFVVVTVWSNFDSVQRTTDLEAGDVGDAYTFAYMLHEPARTEVHRELAAYAIEVRDGEFPALREGRVDRTARKYLIDALRTVATAKSKPTKDVGEALRDDSTTQSVIGALRDIADNRRLRLIEARDHLPPALYVALFVGAIMVLSFVYLFGVEHAFLQLTMTAIVAGCIGLLLGVIVAFNAPFQGAIRVSPEAWNMLIGSNNLRAVNAGKTPPPAAP
jgi:hypothetical protein